MAKKTRRRAAPTKRASTSRAKQPPARKPVPGWLWFVAGILVAAFIWLLASLSGQESGIEVKEPAVMEKPAQPQKPAPAQDVREVKKPEQTESVPPPPKYEFYRILPEMEVEVPEAELEAREAPQPKRYLLQAGSFRKAADADRRKAELALLGIESVIEPVSVKGERWQRVKVGPIEGKRKMNTLRDRMLNNGIQPLVLNAD